MLFSFTHLCWGKTYFAEVGFSHGIHHPKLVIPERPDFSFAPLFGASGRAVEGSLLNFGFQHK